VVGKSELIALKTAPIGNLVIIYSKWAKNHLSDFATFQELTDSWLVCSTKTKNHGISTPTP